MKQKILALLACAIVAAISGLSGNHGRQTVERAEQALLSRVGASLCSFAGTGSEHQRERVYLVLLNVNGKRIGGQVEFGGDVAVGLAAGTNWGPGCH